MTTNLIERVKDRKIAAEIREIQSIISSLQLEHFSAHEKKADLVSENLELKKRISELERKQIPSEKKPSDEFIEFKGVAFKRKPSGGFFDSPYCPICNNSMFSMEKIFPYQCGKCSTASSFKQGELASVFEEFLSEYSYPIAQDGLVNRGVLWGVGCFNIHFQRSGSNNLNHKPLSSGRYAFKKYDY